MTKFKLKNIEIRSFRGIKNYNLKFNDKSLVLVGENGSGKSSIVNAFEFLFTGKVESLSGTHDIKHDQSLVHLGDEPEDLRVSATIANTTITRTLNDDPEDSPILDDFKNGSFLLNRKKLLSFIDQRPKKKYDRITSLIDFQKLDEIEATLNRTQRSFKKRVNAKKDEINQKTSEITDIYGCDITEVLDRINETLTINGLETISADTDLEEFLKEFSKKDFEKANQLSELITLLDIDVSDFSAEFEQLLVDYEKATLSELKHVSTLLDILNKSSEYIRSVDTSICPICQRYMDRDMVLDFIQNHKNELKNDEHTLEEWKGRYGEFSRKINDLNSTIKTIQNILTNFEEYEFNLDLDGVIRDLERLANFEITVRDIEIYSLAELENEFGHLKDTVQGDFDRLNDSENHEELNRIYRAVYRMIQRQNLEGELKTSERQYETAKATYDIFRAEKQRTLEEILDKIQRNVGQYYNYIHENEEFNTPELEAKKASGIGLTLNFKEVIADPRSYSSEGHLDSLGLCIFLAFAKEFNEYDFIILDDIISTVDLGHKERVATLLLTEFKDYRMIITTHNKLWFRQLKNYATHYKLEGNFTFAEIRYLDNATGPDLTVNMFDKELIEKYIEFGDNFAAGNAIRRYLEFMCEKFCRINEVPLPLKKHYMVNDYMTAIEKYLMKGKLFNSAPEVRAYYDAIFRKINPARDLGNVLSHDDDANLDVTLNEVEQFRDSVYEFEKSLKCRECKGFLNFNEEEKHAICTRPRCLAKISFKNQNNG